VLLNIDHKLVVAIVALSPFLLREKKSGPLPWCLSYFATTAGMLISELVLNSWSRQTNMIISAIIVAVLLLCSFLPSVIDNLRKILPGVRDEALFAGNGAVFGGEIVFDDDASGDGRSNGALTVSMTHGEDAAPRRASQTTAVFSMKTQKAAQFLTERFSLSKREAEILVFLIRGRTAKHIAEQLIISPETAKTHIKRIYSKMNIHNQQELISMAESVMAMQRQR
jgi:DNA-binding CsgD family transcriptional regulator